MFELTRSLGLVVPALALTSSLAGAQTVSGPAAGAKAEPFEVYAATGGVAGMHVEVVGQREGLPTIYVFIRADKWDRPVARFLKVLDEKLAEGVQGADGAEMVVVWLTADQDQSKEYLPRAQQSLQLERSILTVFEGETAGPKGWSVNTEAHATAVVVREGKVVQSFGYQSVNETSVPEVLKRLMGP